MKPTINEGNSLKERPENASENQDDMNLTSSLAFCTGIGCSLFPPNLKLSAFISLLISGTTYSLVSKSARLQLITSCDNT